MSQTSVVELTVGHFYDFDRGGKTDRWSFLRCVQLSLAERSDMM